MYFEKQIPLFLELGLSEKALVPLQAYIQHLWKSNENLNLISRKMSFEDLIDNHLIDCLLPLKFFPKNAKMVADFGSGGGLPGVVYALQFPQTTFHLFEKSNLKRQFLEDCKPMASNLKIHGEIPNELGPIELITARAFKSIEITLNLSREYFKNGGKYFFLKARRQKIDEELAEARRAYKNMTFSIEPLKSPVLDVERHLVLIQSLVRASL